jgi:hypothetical protein
VYPDRCTWWRLQRSALGSWSVSKPHAKRCIERPYIKVLAGGTLGGRKSVVLRSQLKPQCVFLGQDFWRTRTPLVRLIFVRDTALDGIRPSSWLPTVIRNFASVQPYETQVVLSSQLL